MTSTALITPEEPTFRETLDETSPLVEAVPLYGPPVIFLAAPWLLLSLVLAGPFALVLTFILLVAALVAVIALICAIVVAPFLGARQLRAYWAAHARKRADAHAPAARLVVSGSR